MSPQCVITQLVLQDKIMILFLVSFWYFPLPVTNRRQERMLVTSRYRRAHGGRLISESFLGMPRACHLGA